MEKSKKVYCNKCRFYGAALLDVECYYEDNVEYKDTWARIERAFKKHPSILNAKNDCKWYQKKECE